MLVITRRPGESIVIGDNIEIKIAEISGEKIRLCIEAPRDVIIMRKELLETAELNKQANVAQGNEVLNELKLRALNLSKQIKKK